MSPKRILLVEDELLIAQDEKLLLESYGYEVTGIAISGEEVLSPRFSHRYFPS